MKTWRTPAKLEALDALTGGIAQFLEENGCPPRAVTQIVIVVEEIFVNIAHYAYPAGGGEALVGCKVAEENGRAAVRLQFEDWGTPYNPLSNGDPDITLPAEERQVGGLGIFMTKKMMDEVAYSHIGGRNKLSLTKYL
ncbi:MAG: ATP-binding protein [Oscillospiraceae bacterium]